MHKQSLETTAFYPNVTTFVHPTQMVETFRNISSPLCTLTIFWPPYKILRRLSQGTLPLEWLNARGVAK